MSLLLVLAGFGDILTTVFEHQWLESLIPEPGLLPAPGDYYPWVHPGSPIR